MQITFLEMNVLLDSDMWYKVELLVASINIISDLRWDYLQNKILGHCLGTGLALESRWWTFVFLLQLLLLFSFPFLSYESVLISTCEFYLFTDSLPHSTGGSGYMVFQLPDAVKPMGEFILFFNHRILHRHLLGCSGKLHPEMQKAHKNILSKLLHY